jgi:hypothetical protein
MAIAGSCLSTMPPSPSQWRTLVLESPRRLNLRLFCTPKTPVKDTLDVWPALPLIVEGRARVLVNKFSWDATDARKIWCFGHTTQWS